MRLSLALLVTLCAVVSADPITWQRSTASAEFPARYRQAAVVFNNRIIVTGGQDISGISLNDVYATTLGSTVTGSSGANWQVLNTNPGWSIRYGHTLTVSNNGASMLLVGGSNVDFGGQTVLYNDVWTTNDGTTWTLRNSNPGFSPRLGHQTVADVNGNIFVIGGTDATGQKNDVWRSNDNGATWTLVNANPGFAARTSFSAFAFDGYLYVTAGNGAAILNDVWRSNDLGVTWTQVANALFSPRQSVATVVLGADAVYISGGVDDQFTYLGQLWKMTHVYTNGNPVATWVQVAVTGVSNDASFLARDYASLVATTRSTNALGNTYQLYYLAGGSFVQFANSDVYAANPADFFPIQYQWRYPAAFSTCTVSCGGGTQSKVATCTDQNGSTGGTCSGTQPATITQACNQGTCTFSWGTPTAYSTCSATCGGGITSRAVSCIATGGSVVADSNCNAATKPVTQTTCNTQACATTYSYGTIYTTCSATCGGGTRTGTTYCLDQNNAIVADSLCTGTKPSDVGTVACNTQTCAVRYSWQADATFGTCRVSSTNPATCYTSGSSSTGIQTRSVVCFDSTTGANTDDNTCTTNGAGTKPATQQSCTLSLCITYDWVQGGFGACTLTGGATCGTGSGTQQQTVVCRSSAGTTVADSFCTNTRPASSQSCTMPACSILYNWFAPSTFGTCTNPTTSETCATSLQNNIGVQSRNVVCQNTQSQTVADSFCNSQTGIGSKPVSQQSCQLPACAVTYSWQLQAYSTCTFNAATCVANAGQVGTRTAVYACVTNTGSVTADSNCVNANLGSKPASVVDNTCIVSQCAFTYQYVYSSYGTCTPTTGGPICSGTGVATRTATCLRSDNAQVDITLCQASIGAPTLTQSCSLSTCNGVWLASPTSACINSATGLACGSGAGLMSYTVTCRDPSNNIVDERYCALAGTKPATSQSCTLTACTGAWVATASSQCINPSTSLPCGTGNGLMTYSVICRDTITGQTVNDGNCVNAGTKPATQQSCTLTACTTYFYSAGAYGNCFGTCGTGTRTRTVSCISSATNLAVDASFCSGQTAPVSQESCALSTPCFNWQLTSSGTCVPGNGQASCGTNLFGTRTTVYTCFNYLNVQQADSVCVASIGASPATTVSCQLPTCAITYAWRTGTYGQCLLGGATCASAANTLGVSTRSVACYGSDNNLYADTACSSAGTKPATSQSCTMPVCVTYSWSTGQFGSCSAPCNGGVAVRSVICVDNTNTQVADSLCTSSSRPVSSQPCNVFPCTNIVGDPEFQGFLGQKYEIHGVPNSVFNIITSPHVQYNALFVYLGEKSKRSCNATRTHGWTHPGTYLGTLGFKVGSDRIQLSAGDCLSGIKRVTLNGKPLSVGASVAIGIGSAGSKAINGEQLIQFVDAYTVKLFLSEVTIELVNSDKFFNQKVTMTGYGERTKQMHGLLGQTHKKDHFAGYDGVRRVIEGTSADYMVQDEDLFGNDFVFNRYEVYDESIVKLGL